MTTYESAAYASWEKSWCNDYEDEEEEEEDEEDFEDDEREEYLSSIKYDEERYLKWLYK